MNPTPKAALTERTTGRSHEHPGKTRVGQGLPRYRGPSGPSNVMVLNFAENIENSTASQNSGSVLGLTGLRDASGHAGETISANPSRSARESGARLPGSVGSGRSAPGRAGP